MAEFPALPLFTDAYLGDTTHLTTIEHGAYLLLLMTAWRAPGTRLPDDDKLLARYARLGTQQWARIKPVIAAFFDIADGHWTQRRLTDEAVAVRRHRDLQAEKGRASALKRKGRHATTVGSGSRPVATEPLPEGNLPSPTYTLANAKGAAAPFDPIKTLFDEGIDLLTGAGGRAAKEARGLIGKWRKAVGDERASAAITAAREQGVSDPVAWIEGRIRRERAGGEDRDAYNQHIIEQARRMRAAEGVE